MQDSFELESSHKQKNAGCPKWQVWVGCSLLVAIGLGVGLGVGLSNQKTVIVVEETTVKSPMTTKTTATQTTIPTTTAAATTTIATVPDDGPWKNYRLPNYITPFHYQLTLHPNMTTQTYTGINAMNINITQNTKYILVHADAKLEILSCKLHKVLADMSTEDIPITQEFRVPEYEYYVVSTENELEPNTGGEYYVLTMEFQSSLVLRIVGLYMSFYKDDKGNEKTMVGSDMEPTDARKAYPCFDEPALKIEYTTALIHEPHHTALSNMDVDMVDDTSRADGLYITKFKKSVPMSTYLGCFAVSEFTYLEKFSKKKNISLRVYVPPHQLAAGQANYAMDVMKEVFDYFEEFFGMDYSLPKCDMISIPNFGTGAMENWGLITYRETNLLWDPMESSTTNKQRVAAVIAHELVHQWFGNVVTMKWWDNIWLNEGFASFFEYYGQREAEPEWQIMDHFVIDDAQRALSVDDTLTSHPVVVNVSSPGQITSVFDTISYSKGACVLKVMRDWLGEDIFMGGIKHYLQKRLYSNADEKDLFADVQEYLDTNTTISFPLSVSEYMNPWVLQMGYPVVNVSSSNEADQNHFLTDPNADLTTRPGSVYNYNWNVQLTYFTSDDPTVKNSLLEIGNTLTLNLSSLPADGWFKLNSEQAGYYRVNYDKETWRKISEQLMTNHTVFSELDRSNLINDGFEFAPANILSYPEALNLTRYLDKETSYFVWDAFSGGSSYIRIMLESSDIYTDFKLFYKQKVKPIADELGWNATVGTHVEKLNRYLVLALALRYGDEDALDNATGLFSNWIADESYYLYPDTRQLVYRYGNPTASEWEIMLERYIREPVASEKTNLLRGLTSTEDVALIDRMLDNCYNDSIVLSQDFFNCVTYISYTPTGNRMAWSWVQLYWADLVTRFGIDDRNLGRLVPNIVSDYNTELQLWEVEAFYEKNPPGDAGESGRVSTIDSIKTNIQWMKDNQEAIGSWLANELAVMP
ncbi:glutamyl aminopeptidase-like [Clavelina lepadiformis]|uniref:glutamyl aminopeptidase-like n=1 Tax=Clavelina lepadiformis TaxID=159417 RepID=UPI00404156DD